MYPNLRIELFRMIRFHLHATAFVVAPLAVVLGLFLNLNGAEEPAPVAKPEPAVAPSSEEPAAKPAPKPARKSVKLPGLVIDLPQRCVDIESTVCLEDGFLELIACTKETKEHESIVVVKARPMHIHTALLLLGAKNGNPAMMRPVDEQQTRWVHIPPRGDPVDVYLEFKDSDGKMVERPISDFVTRAARSPDEQFDPDNIDADNADANESNKFPRTFLFAGSHLHGDGPGPRKYLADLSGNVISIATFGDELLCLPGVHAKANDALMWQINAAKLPKVGSNVTLRLRVKQAKSFNAEPAGDGKGCAKPSPASSALNKRKENGASQ